MKNATDFARRTPRSPDVRRCHPPTGYRGNSVGKRFYIDTQYFPQERPAILPGAQRIASAAAISHADIEHAIRSEDNLTAVVVGKRLFDGQHHFFAGGIGAVAGGAEP